MSEQRTALLELIDKIEHLGQFQDRIDFPATIGQIWDVFLDDVRGLINIEVCALFVVDDDSHEFVLEYVSPEDKKKNMQTRSRLSNRMWHIFLDYQSKTTGADTGPGI